MEKALHWPNRIWERSGNFHPDGSPLWVSREPTAEDRQDRRFVEQNWPPSGKDISKEFERLEAQRR